MADYTLPDLPYDYGALEPHVSGEIMELHHSKHQRQHGGTSRTGPTSPAGSSTPSRWYCPERRQS